jgi:putative ubiquitin-RnfH superfamily antitoxin RatB of RatAB toxin-antitoxin module
MAEPMGENRAITVEVAYALPHKQFLLEVQLPQGATALDAARKSGITDKIEGLDLENATFGIFGQIVAAMQVLRAGDRVEIYRPLLADPKEVRKARAERARERRQRGKPD